MFQNVFPVHIGVAAARVLNVPQDNICPTMMWREMLRASTAQLEVTHLVQDMPIVSLVVLGITHQRQSLHFARNALPDLTHLVRDMVVARNALLGIFHGSQDPISALCVLPVPTHLVPDIVTVFYVPPDFHHQFRDLTPALNVLLDIAHQIQDMTPALNALLDITHRNQDAIALALRVPLDRTKARLDKLVVLFVQQEVIANLKHL